MATKQSIEEKEVLKVDDLMGILGIGKNTAYNLMKSEGFPSKQIGRLWIISKLAFENWLNNQSKN